MNIKLHDFVTRTLAGVFHIHADVHLAGGLDFVRRQFQAAVFERGVAQAVAKREERFAVHIHVGETFCDVVFVHRRHLRFRGIHGVRQPAGGIYVAEKNIGNRVAALFARPPGLQQRGNIRGNPRHGQRPGAHLHNHRARIGGEDGFDQFFLVAGQSKRFAVAAFLLNLPVSADDDDGDIGFAREIHGLL